MQLKIATDYAIRIVLYLAMQKRTVSSRELSEKMNVPQSEVYKITRKLKKANILKNVHGVEGGYELASHPGDITLYHIINLIESTTKINRCLEDDQYCSRFSTENCPVRNFYITLQTVIEDSLNSITVESLIEKAHLMVGDA